MILSRFVNATFSVFAMVIHMDAGCMLFESMSLCCVVICVVLKRYIACILLWDDQEDVVLWDTTEFAFLLP